MSTTSPPATATATATAAATTSSSSSFFHSLGLGYVIATALGLLVLLSTLLLASYICCRSPRPRGPDSNAAGSGGAVLPRVIFVTEEDDDNEVDVPGDEESGTAAAGRHQSSAASGLDQATISSYPKFAFSGAKGGDAVCSICLCEYREGETLRMMPDCRHYFHLPCIDAWLRLNASCPVCRSSPMPTPLSTPLSELVPLSHYAADRRR